MNTLSDSKNGEQTPTRSLQKPPSFSDDLGLGEISEKWLTEQWLFSAGVVPDSSADTLLMYAYAQRGVEKVELVIDRDEKNSGKNPSVTYNLIFQPWTFLKWKAVERAEKIKNVIFRKLMLLFLSNFNAPLFIKEAIRHSAKEYLPPQYAVFVEVKNE